MIKRALSLERRMGDDRSAFLFGPRGAGKTVLSREFLAGKRTVMEVNLLEFRTFQGYLTDHGKFIKEVEARTGKGRPLTVFLDEIQKLPHLLDEVHHLIESHKGAVQFLMTGSSARKLKRGGVNLLAGRAMVLHLHPLSALECDIDLDRALRFGTLPAMYLSDRDPSDLLEAYAGTYLREEVRQEALVRKVEGYVRFLDVAAQMNGEPMNFSRVARESAVTDKTAREFASILEDTMLAFRLDGWSRSLRKQLLAAPKYYFFDCGVLNALTRDLAAASGPHSFRRGRLFETFVIQELIRWNDYKKAGLKFHYWRTNSGQEVDVVATRSASAPLLAVEIKSGPAPAERDFHGLRAFASEHGKAELLCLCAARHPYKAGPVAVYPWKLGLEHIFSKTG